MQGAIYPALQSLIARWAPPEEKGKFVSALMGNTLGTVCTWPLLGAIIEGVGWQWAFVVPGVLAVTWSLIWAFTVADSPSDHRWISVEERDYINKSLSGGVKKVKVFTYYLYVATSGRLLTKNFRKLCFSRQLSQPLAY